MIYKFCQSKIRNNCFKIFIQENIGGLDITMDYLRITLFMQIEQSLWHTKGYPLSAWPVLGWFPINTFWQSKGENSAGFASKRERPQNIMPSMRWTKQFKGEPTLCYVQLVLAIVNHVSDWLSPYHKNGCNGSFKNRQIGWLKLPWAAEGVLSFDGKTRIMHIWRSCTWLTSW